MSFSIDIPAGCRQMKGVKHFQAVTANETVIAGFPKMSAFLEHTASYYGMWDTILFGLPANTCKSMAHSACLEQKKIFRQKHA
ncbi:hypothetical protein [Lentibacillus sp. CBA3610]|uniref:hypothetical protein n=1 Tax=Lentibacillus sp. CBA3610 TaxID=2518176 RepID=UPI0015950558|nr:hypothetical protein [Lentibacillus sp. CBA3610]QKY71207.1 hypothetical protein Len3610_18030 [Lentibacillus sp. CBA3610]